MNRAPTIEIDVLPTVTYNLTYTIFLVIRFLFIYCLVSVYLLFTSFMIRKNKKNPDNTTVTWILIWKIIFIFLKIRVKFTLNE